VTVIANAGPLIALARINHFYLLRLLYNELRIPTAVRNEIITYGEARPEAIELKTAD
jgi:predicted nucleic acid-binding protein